MKTLTTVALVAFTVAACKKTADVPGTKIQSSTASYITVQRDSGSAPISSFWWDECTNEQVNFTATVHWNNVLVYNGDYGCSRWYLSRSRTKLSDIKAIGEKSRKTYCAININNYTSLQDSSFNSYFYTNYATLKIIAPDKGSSMILTQKVVLVTNLDGTTIVDMDTESSTCK